MNLVLFITVIVVSFIVVRIGAIAFQLTGLDWSVAKFQALSCFTSTGFTTSESELIVKDRQRRRIASILIVLGHAGFVTMIATLANSLRAQRVLEEKLTKSFLPAIPPMLVPWVNLGVIIIVLYFLYKFSTNSTVAKKVTNFLRAKIIKKELIHHISFEELMLATGGYGVARISVTAGSPVINKTLSEAALRSQDITVLAITREGKTSANPTATSEILLNDELLCFGKLENIRNKICMVP
jgi:Trk-type K+ transport system membrane component